MWFRVNISLFSGVREYHNLRMNRHFFGAWVFNEFDTHTHTDIDEALNTSMILWGIAQVGAWTWDGGDLGVSSIFQLDPGQSCC